MNDYNNLRKFLELPEGITAPSRLENEDFYARPLARNDIDADLAGVNSSIEIIQKTRGGSWPSGVLNKDEDLLDLAWHEREYKDGDSFAYVIYTNNDEYVGCFYLYAVGVRTPLTEQNIDYDVDASWWVTTDMYENGYYEKVYEALHKWLTENFKFSKVLYSNKHIPDPKN
jgi:hypothetical protein